MLHRWAAPSWAMGAIQVLPGYDGAVTIARPAGPTTSHGSPLTSRLWWLPRVAVRALASPLARFPLLAYAT